MTQTGVWQFATAAEIADRKRAKSGTERSREAATANRERIAAIATRRNVCIEEALKLAASARNVTEGKPFPPNVGGRVFRELSDVLDVREGVIADRARALGLWPWSVSEIAAAFSPLPVFAEFENEENH